METKEMPIETVATTSAMGAAAAVLQWVGLPWEPLSVLVVLMSIDFLAGVSAAYAVGEPITSRKIKVGALGKMLTLLVIFTVGLCAKLMGADGPALVGWAVMFMGLSEGYSIISNVIMLKTGQPLPEWDALAMLGKKIRQILTKMLGD